MVTVEKGNPKQRPAVTRERAIEAAVELADASGLAALSMRKLATSLGVEAMSLYYHVKSKDALVNGMVEFVVSEMALPAEDAHWSDALRERALSTRSVLGRHPWAIGLIDSETTRATLRYHDAAVRGLRRAGFSFAMAGHAMSLLDSYVLGFAMQEASLPTDAAGDIGAATEAIISQQEAMATDFPYLSAMAGALILQPGYAFGNEFEFGLGVILHGVAVAQAAEPESV